MIDDFALTFKDGKIVDFTAEKGAETLGKLIDTDEGSHYLGEVALVPFKSPISDTNIVFFNTLFDENASCHFAIGSAYKTCIKNGDDIKDEELDKYGVCLLYTSSAKSNSLSSSGTTMLFFNSSILFSSEGA